MPKHRINPTDNELITLSFRAYGRHHKLVHMAAQAKGMSAQDYMSEIVLNWAAADLGQQAPTDTYTAVRSQQIETAAAAVGMTLKEFAAFAVREATGKILERNNGTLPPPPPRELPQPAQHQAPPRRTISGTQRRVG